MKTSSYASYVLAALLGVASLPAAPKEKPAKAPLLLVIPGDPGRPYKVIDNVAGVFEVTYKVTFTKGIGGMDSYQEALGEAFDQVRAAAKQSGADAVIHTQFDYVPFPDSVIKDEEQLRGSRVIGLIKLFGTQVKFVDAPTAAAPRTEKAEVVATVAAPLTQAQRESIKGNLRQLDAAANQYYLESGKMSATYADLVGPTKYVREVKPVAGENYAAINFEYGKPLTVTTQSGEKVEYSK